MSNGLKGQSSRELSADSMNRQAMGFSDMPVPELETAASPRETEEDLLNLETLLHDIDIHYLGPRTVEETVDLAFIDG